MKKNELLTLGERLNYAMSQAGMSQGMLAKQAGMAQPTIWRIATGRANGSSKILDIAKALNVRPEWLVSGEEPMTADDYSNKPESKKNENHLGDNGSDNASVSEDEVDVVLLKDIEFAGSDDHLMKDGDSGHKVRFSKSTLHRVGANPSGSSVVCFPIRGGSMEPAMPDGTTVAVNLEDKKIVDGKIYAINENGWKRIKLLYRTGPDTVSIRSYNSAEFPAEEKSLQDLEILGRVFWYSVLL